MTQFFQVILLGVVQGLTEFLPVSSSAHLILFPWFFNWPNMGLTFDISCHFGTLLALLTYFRKQIKEMILSFFQKSSESSLNKKVVFAIYLYRHLFF